MHELRESPIQKSQHDDSENDDESDSPAVDLSPILSLHDFLLSRGNQISGDCKLVYLPAFVSAR
jgi:hypothetical protein